MQIFPHIRWVNSRVLSGQSVVCASAMMKTISMLGKVPMPRCAGPVASSQLHRYVSIGRVGAVRITLVLELAVETSPEFSGLYQTPVVRVVQVACKTIGSESRKVLTLLF